MPRYTIDVGDKFDSILKELSVANETTKSEIIRKAVALYSYLSQELENKERGKKLSITDREDRVLKDIVLP